MTYQLPKGVSRFKNNTRYRFRVTSNGETVQTNLNGIVGAEGSDEFVASMEAAIEAVLVGKAVQAPAPVKQLGRVNMINPGTLGLAYRIYQETAEYRALDAKTQRNRRDLVERFLDSVVFVGETVTWKEITVAEIGRKALNSFLDAVAIEAPSQPVKLLRAIRRLVKVAIDEEWIKPEQDPTYMMKRAKTKGAWKAWPAHEMAAFELRHPLGTTARTAYELTKWTGQRQGDITVLRRSQIQVVRRIEGDAIIAERFFMVEQEKNAKRREGGAKLAPVLVTPMLEEAIAHVPAGQDYLLAKADGTPYAKSGMTTRFADWREEAGLTRHGYSQHGLRKVLGGLISTAGGTTKENMAVLGHDDMKHAELYSKSADDIVLSGSAGRKVIKLVRG